VIAPRGSFGTNRATSWNERLFSGWHRAIREERRVPMFVTVIHRIHDPEGFQAAEATAMEGGIPPHVALPIHAATNDHGLGICIWEGE